MHSPRIVRFLAVVVAVVVGFGDRSAQAQTAASYRPRVDSIAADLTRREGEQATRDSIERAQLPHDTIRVGAFSIVTDTQIADVVRRSVLRANASLEQTIGRTSTALDTITFAAIPSRDSSNRRPRALVLAQLDRQGVLAPQSSWYLDEVTLAKVWEGRAGEVLAAAAGADIAAWLKREMPVADREDEWRDARVELVTARAAAARRCFRGDARSCASALVLVKTETPLMDWYDAEERRDFLRRYPHVLRREHNATRFDACVKHGDDEACDALAREVDANSLEAPLGQASRRSLVLMALKLGGPGAYGRLVRAQGTIEARLSTAAGVPADSLLRAWHERVANAPGTDGPFSTSTAVASLCLVTLCALLALRSSRWR